MHKVYSADWSHCGCYSRSQTPHGLGVESGVWERDYTPPKRRGFGSHWVWCSLVPKLRLKIRKGALVTLGVCAMYEREM